MNQPSSQSDPANSSPATTTGATESWTVRQVLDWTIGHLKKCGCETPRLDAEILLAHARSCQRIMLYTDYDSPLSLEERGVMRELVKRRATLEPVAYLVGHREFFSLDFDVEPGVLIPRPDTETLVVQLLELIEEVDHPKILELCTGTGCIPVAVAKNHRSATITAVEIDPQVVKIAQRNVEKHEVGDRVDVRQGDLFEPIAEECLFDIVASNPPYVTTAELATIQPDVRLHEPHLALDGGADGLNIVRRIVDGADPQLKPGGALLIEIAPEQADTVVDLIAKTGCYLPAQAARDFGGHSRVIWARKKL